MIEDADGFLIESPAEERERQERESDREERWAMLRTRQLARDAEKLSELAQALAGWLSADYPEPPELDEAHDLIVAIAECLGKVAPYFAPAPGKPMTADGLLRVAVETIGERGQKYGDLHARFGDMAKLWTILLGHPVRPHQAALCMAALKMTRLIEDPALLDSWVDCAAYTAIGCQLAGVQGEV